MPKLIIRDARNQPYEFELADGRTLIGRGEECGIVVEDEGVSRHHATLEVNGSETVLEDAGSRNGTLVNGERVQRVRLHDGDVLQIGRRTELRFEVLPAGGESRERAEDHPGRSHAPGAGGWLNETRCVLTPRFGGAEAQEVSCSSTTVGRDPGVGLHIDAEGVSRLHARLDIERGRVFITDLDSRNGTWVNGTPVTRAELQSGDVLVLGSVEFDVAISRRFSIRRLVRWRG